MWQRSWPSGRCGHLYNLTRWCGSGIVLWLLLTADCYLWTALNGSPEQAHPPAVRIWLPEGKIRPRAGLRCGTTQLGERTAWTATAITCHKALLPCSCSQKLETASMFQTKIFLFFFPRSRETNTSLSKMIARTKFELMMDRYPREWVSEDTCQCYCWQVLGGVDSFIWDLVPNQALRSFKNMTPTLNALLLIKLRSFQRTLSNAEYLDFWESLS